MTDRGLRELLTEMGQARRKKMTAPGTTLKSWGLGLRTDSVRANLPIPAMTPENKAAAVVAMQSQQKVPLDLKVGDGDDTVLFLDTVAHSTQNDDITYIDLRDLLSATRGRLGKELLTHNTMVKRVVSPYLVVFDNLVEGEPPYLIAKQLKVSSQRVDHMIKTIKAMPAWRKFETELRAMVHG